MEAFAKLVDAVAHLIGAVAWPVVVIFAALRFGQPIRELIKNFDQGSFKGFGFEATAKKVAVESIVAAQNEKPVQPQSETEIRSEETTASLAKSVKLITRSTIRASSQKSILWVDDKPENNINERRALRAIGFKLSKSKSTESALIYLRDGNEPDIIISDLSRPEGYRAGFDLLEKLKPIAQDVPFIIYSGIFKYALRDEAKTRGAFGYTSDPAKLIALVLKAAKTSAVFD